MFLLHNLKCQKKSWTKQPAVEECLDGKLPLVLPSTPVPPVLRRGKDRGMARQPLPSSNSPKSRSPEDCCKRLCIKSSRWQPHRLGEQRCTKPIWGLCSGPLASTAWLACKAAGQDQMLWPSTAMLSRSYKRKQRISQQEDYCESPF